MASSVLPLQNLLGSNSLLVCVPILGNASLKPSALKVAGYMPANRLMLFRVPTGIWRLGGDRKGLAGNRREPDFVIPFALTLQITAVILQ